ncbi:MAG: hypothetical protein ABI818_11315 [Acidobacteriota bacterium]
MRSVTSGGGNSIAWSDHQQTLVMTLGLAAAAVSAVPLLPIHVSLADAWHLAAAADASTSSPRRSDAGLLHHSDQGCTPYASEDYHAARGARHHPQQEPPR